MFYYSMFLDNTVQQVSDRPNLILLQFFDIILNVSFQLFSIYVSYLSPVTMLIPELFLKVPFTSPCDKYARHYSQCKRHIKPSRISCSAAVPFSCADQKVGLSLHLFMK